MSEMLTLASTEAALKPPLELLKSFHFIDVHDVQSVFSSPL